MKPFWTENALDQFADIYARLSVTRQRVLAATIDRVNRELTARPLDVGEGREFPDRVWIVPPVTIWYKVTAVDGTVEVVVGGVTEA